MSAESPASIDRAVQYICLLFLPPILLRSVAVCTSSPLPPSWLLADMSQVCAVLTARDTYPGPCLKAFQHFQYLGFIPSARFPQKEVSGSGGYEHFS